jgi:hypothetical protein
LIVFDRIHAGRPLSAALRLSGGVRDISRVDCLSTADRSAALGVVSSLVEWFDFTLSAVFPRVLSFACAFLETAPPEALPSNAASACLLMRASPACCLPELRRLLPLILSAPGVAAVFEAELDAAVCALDLNALVSAFAAGAYVADALGSATLFRALSRALRDADRAPPPQDIPRRVLARIRLRLRRTRGRVRGIRERLKEI